MKRFFKLLPALMAVPMILILFGCKSPTAAAKPDTPAASTAPQAVDRSAAAADASSAPVSSAPADPSDTGSLVVYFSWSGNTQQMAEWIADESGSDLYRVTPKEGYGDDYDVIADRAKNELDNGIRPELADLMDAQTMAQYDTLYVGFPIWWYDLPMPMTAFLESYDLSGKTIIPFFSHNGSSSGASAPETLAEICAGADVLADDALALSGSSVKDSEAQIRKWVNQLNK